MFDKYVENNIHKKKRIDKYYGKCHGIEEQMVAKIVMKLARTYH